MYSKLNKLFGYFYSVVLTIQRSKMAFTNDASPVVKYSGDFGFYRCEIVVKVWLTLDRVGSRQVISSHLTSHSLEEDDAS